MSRPDIRLNRRAPGAGWNLWAAAVILAAAALFLLPALGRTGGIWPTPLDDTYIYFGCARSFGMGAPFSWYPGNGYSSGCTSILYPMLLAPAWALGLRGSALGIAATALACLCVFDLTRSLRRCTDHPIAAWLAPLLCVAIPLLDWSWFSGMETALVGALLGRGLWAARRALDAPPERRRGAQLRAGVWLALAALTRPETVPLAAMLATALAYRGRSLSAVGSLLRTAGPAIGALGLQGVANRVLTGEWAQAGAVRKLIWSDPFVQDGGLAYVQNLAVLADQAVGRAFGGTLLALCLPALMAVGLWRARHRGLVIALLLGAVGGLLMVCAISTARYQNYRHAAPLLMMLLMAAALGLDALSRLRRARWLGPALVVTGIAAAGSQLQSQREHFAAASANIVDQQVAVAAELRALYPTPKRILIHDAGAIPYLAEIPPIDAFGLGGFRGMPFARASRHGQPAVVELIERLPQADRPEVMALYPAWWPEIVSRFASRIGSVRIDDNVICGANEKVIYRADWSTLAEPNERPPGVVDAVDIADLVDERAHGFRFEDGRVISAALRNMQGRQRYDAGRILAGGRPFSFRVTPRPNANAWSTTASHTTLWLRTDRSGESATVRILRDRAVVAESLASARAPRQSGSWTILQADLDDLQPGDRIAITPAQNMRAFHVWVVRVAHTKLSSAP